MPLRSGSEFFQVLQNEILGLDALQTYERGRLTTEVNRLALTISDIVNLVANPRVSDLYAWRTIFQLYIESEIFFSTSERDGGSRDATSAEKQLELFSNELDQQQMTKKLKGKQSRVALGQFLRFNQDLLRNLRFQELNQTATVKILKSALLV